MYSGTCLAEQTGVKAPVELNDIVSRVDEGRAMKREDQGGHTGKREEDNLLVGPLLGGVVVDGDTAGGDVSLLLSPGDVAGGLLVSKDSHGLT